MTKKVEVLKEEIEQREFSNTMETWSRNRARVEEEINRRQESYRFSSQTGTRIHTRPPSATIRGASSLSNSRPGSARARSATPTTSSTPRPGLPTPAVLHRRQTRSYFLLEILRPCLFSQFGVSFVVVLAPVLSCLCCYFCCCSCCICY